MRDLVGELAQARIGTTFNQYTASPLLRDRLRRYLEERGDARLLLVGEAAGYRGARVSGIPFTSERQLTGSGPAEATATIVHRTLAALGLADDVLLWNVVPTHPGTDCSNRPPTRAEVAAGVGFARRLGAGREVVAVGRVAAAALDAPYLRHPSHGGAAGFLSGLALPYDESMRLTTASPFVRYAVLSAAIIAVTAWVPGDPSYADQGSASVGTAVVTTVLVLACLLTKARLSWYIAAVLDGMGLALFGAVLLLEVPGGFDAFKPLALTLLAGLQIGVLFSQGFDDWLRRREVAPV